MKVADDGSVKVDVVKVADDAWHEARPLGTTAWLVRNDIDIKFDIAWKLVLHAFSESSQRLLRKGFSRLRHRSHSHSHSLPQQRKASPHTAHDTRLVTSPHSALRTHERCQRQAPRPAARGLRSGPLRVVPRVFTRHAFHTLTTLALHRPRRSISVITRPLAHATCRVLDSCVPGSRTAAHTLCVRVPPLLRYLKCMHTLYVRVPPLFVSQMYMLTYKRTEHHVRY